MPDFSAYDAYIDDHFDAFIANCATFAPSRRWPGNGWGWPKTTALVQQKLERWAPRRRW